LGFGIFAQTPPEVVFRNVAAAAGVNVTHVNGASPRKYFAEIMGSGGLFFDFDDDGWIDIFLVDGGSIASPTCGRDRQDTVCSATRERNIRGRLGQSVIVHREYGMGACAGDYDNDGLVDLYVTNYGPNQLFRNSRQGPVRRGPEGRRCGDAAVEHELRVSLTSTGKASRSVCHQLRAGGQSQQQVLRNRSPVMLRGYCHPLAYDPSPNVLYRNTARVRSRTSP
jgi:hypothetical protein